MSVNVEEVLGLVAGYEEAVVGLSDGGPTRLDYWTCGLWSVESGRRGVLGDVAVGLWLRYVLGRYLDPKTAEAVASSRVYRAVKESLKELDVEGNPEVKYEELHFKPVELRLRGVYGRRAVYELKPFGCDVKALAVRVYVPTWILCPREEPTCEKHAELTKRLHNKGASVEDATRGIYVPIDASELENFLKRVL